MRDLINIIEASWGDFNSHDFSKSRDLDTFNKTQNQKSLRQRLVSLHDQYTNNLKDLQRGALGTDFLQTLSSEIQELASEIYNKTGNSSSKEMVDELVNYLNFDKGVISSNKIKMKDALMKLSNTFVAMAKDIKNAR